MLNDQIDKPEASELTTLDGTQEIIKFFHMHSIIWPSQQSCRSEVIINSL